MNFNAKAAAKRAKHAKPPRNCANLCETTAKPPRNCAKPPRNCAKLLRICAKLLRNHTAKPLRNHIVNPLRNHANSCKPRIHCRCSRSAGCSLVQQCRVQPGDISLHHCLFECFCMARVNLCVIPENTLSQFFEKRPARGGLSVYR